MSWKPIVVAAFAWVVLVLGVGAEYLLGASRPWLLTTGALAGYTTASLVNAIARRRWVREAVMAQTVAMLSTTRRVPAEAVHLHHAA